MKGVSFLILLCLIISVCKCTNDEMIYVHLIPHSHDDYGWLFSIDQYYNNPSPFSGQGSVRDIINSVNTEIQKNNARKYIQVEIGFLNMWWQSKGETERQAYKKSIESGQIEIINGGWTMHDEATPYFEDLIDQMTVGHLWVKDKLGVIPTVGWQLDPFGHQSSNAALYSQMGLNAQWFARIDYQDFAKRKGQQSLEMIWSPEQNSGEENYIFSAVNIQHYSPPKDFYFEIGETVTANNVQQKSEKFVNYFKKMRSSFKSNHLLHTMGEDFAYSRAGMWYDSMDNLISYINQRSEQYGMKILYSTPSQYLQEINKQTIEWPVNNNDFYPYADQQNAYWTGYFTSRPAVKGFTKDTGRYLQAIRNLFSMERMNKRSERFNQNFLSYIESLEHFEQQVATMSHHDAITGTQKQSVAFDYINRLNQGYEKIRSHLHPLLQEYTQQDIQEESVSYTQCNWNATISDCSITHDQLQKGSPVLIMIYNPSVKRTLNIRIKIPLTPILIINEKNDYIIGDVICSNPSNQQDCDLYFIDEFEGYAYNYYKMLPQLGKDSKPIQPLKLSQQLDIINIELSQISSIRIDTKKSIFSHKVWVEEKDEYIRQFRQKENTFQLQYNFYYGYDRDQTQGSGAYIFRPTEQESRPYSELKNINVFKGKSVTVIVFVGSKITTQVRVFNDQSMQNVYELETFIDSIDVSDNKGKEIVMLITTNLKNQGVFYTDSNGLEMQQRKLNYRPTWNLSVNEPVSGNYYPIGAMISIKDNVTKAKVSVVNDRSQGGTSLKEGQIEIMIHRRLLKDDGRGVGESLNERDQQNPNSGLTQKVRHYIVFENDGDQLNRKIQNQLDSSPLIFLSKSVVPQISSQRRSRQISALQGNNNPYLRVYFRTFDGYYTLRLYNINESAHAEFKLPSNLKIEDELTLTANQTKSQWASKQMKWSTPSGKVFQPSQNTDLPNEIETNKIRIKPMQLRVFKIVQV